MEASRDDDAVQRDEKDAPTEALNEAPVAGSAAAPQAIADPIAAPPAGDGPPTTAAMAPAEGLNSAQGTEASEAETASDGRGAPLTAVLNQGGKLAALAAHDGSEGEEKTDKAGATAADAGSEPMGKSSREAGRAEHAFDKLIDAKLADGMLADGKPVDGNSLPDADPASTTDLKADLSPQAGIPQGPAAGARAAAVAAPVPQGPVLHQVPLGAVPIEIGLKSLAGINRFEIRLDPAELGRIDVRLEIGEAGDVKAHLTVDRVETLALLQRDARTLERAFEQAGLKPQDGGVNLSLRDPSGDGRPQDQSRDERGQRHNQNPDIATPAGEPREAAATTRVRTWRGITGVDLRI